MSRTLFLVSAAVEVGAGVTLILVPSTIVSVLIGGTLDSSAALAVARLAGAALVTIGLICWFAGCDATSRAAAGVVAAMLFYNVAAVAVLLYVRFGMAMAGVGTWPAIVAHGALAGWCLTSIRRPAA